MSDFRLRRTDRYALHPLMRPVEENEPGSEQEERPLPQRNWLDRLSWRVLPKRRVQAFFATAGMMPPEGACSWTDLVGRPGALTNYMEFGSAKTPTVVFEACCPGCARLVARLDPQKHRISGDGAGLNTSLTCQDPIWFSYCCGWYGYLLNGEWKGRRGTLIAARRQGQGRR